MIRRIQGHNKNHQKTSMNSIKAISFDLDDTLWDNLSVIHRANKKLYQKMVFSYPVIEEHFDQSAFDQVGFEIANSAAHSSNLSLLREKHIISILETCQCSIHQAKEFFDYYYYWRNQVELFPAVRQTLQQLSQSYPLVSATNGNINLEQIGLKIYFNFSVCAADVSEKKPGLKMYQAIIKELDLPAAQILHIGDSFQNDVMASIKVGMKAIWFNPQKLKYPEPNKNILGSISCVSELISLLNLD